MQVCMLIFVVSIPLMLCVKPIILGCCISHPEDLAEDFKESDVEMRNINGGINVSYDITSPLIEPEAQKNQLSILSLTSKHPGELMSEESRTLVK